MMLCSPIDCLSELCARTWLRLCQFFIKFLQFYGLGLNTFFVTVIITVLLQYEGIHGGECVLLLNNITKTVFKVVVLVVDM